MPARTSAQSSSEAMQRRNAGQAMKKVGGGRSPRPNKIPLTSPNTMLPNKIPLAPHLKVVLAKMLYDLGAKNEDVLMNAGKKTMKDMIYRKIMYKHEIIEEKPLAKIPAGFDQLSLSLFTKTFLPSDVLGIFSEKFGEPIKCHSKFWHHFRNGLKLSRSNEYYYHTIRFSDLALLDDLAPLRKIFPDRQESGKPSSPSLQLASAEVKFDYPLPNLLYKEAESILQAFALFLIPQRNKYAALKEYRGNHFKHTSDAINGRLLFYFGKLHKLPFDEAKEEKSSISSPWQIKSDSSWRGKIYLKSFDKGTTWNIRIEVTLKGSALCKIGGKKISKIATVLHFKNRLAKLCFNDFWKMEIFDRNAFLDEAMPIFEASTGKARSMSRLIILRLMELEDNQHTIRQKRLARRLAKMLDSNSLLRHLDKGKFSTPLQHGDVL